MDIIESTIQDEMEVFYNLIKMLNSLGIKYKIKGNILIHFIQYSRDYNNYFRGTKDLDLDTEYNQLNKIVELFTDLSPRCTVVTAKNGIIRRLSGINIFNIEYVDLNSIESLSLDDEYTEKYTINGEEFYGNSIEGIFKDKIASVSTQKVSRRFKDVIDLYILKNMLLISDFDFINILNKYKKGEFEFIEDKNTVRAMTLFEGLEPSDGVDIEYIYNYMVKLINMTKPSKKSIGGLEWN